MAAKLANLFVPRVFTLRSVRWLLWLLLALLGIMLIARPVAASDHVIEIEGFKLSSAAPLAKRDIAAMRRQINGVIALPVDPKILAFFREQPIILRDDLGQHGMNVREGVVLSTSSDFGDKPVLLHELLHRFHALRLPGGVDNPVVGQALVAARKSGDWPDEAYMLMNRTEFFAMTASAVLQGSIARPPFGRKEVERKLPEFYRWIVAEFGYSR